MRAWEATAQTAADSPGNVTLKRLSQRLNDMDFVAARRLQHDTFRLNLAKSPDELLVPLLVVVNIEALSTRSHSDFEASFRNVDSYVAHSALCVLG